MLRQSLSRVLGTGVGDDVVRRCRPDHLHGGSSGGGSLDLHCADGGELLAKEFTQSDAGLNFLWLFCTT